MIPADRPSPFTGQVAADFAAFRISLRAGFAAMAAAAAATAEALIEAFRPLAAVYERRARVQLRDGRRVHPSHVRPPRLAIDGRAYHRRRRTRRNTR